jgi:hypothetical protein
MTPPIDLLTLTLSPEAIDALDDRIQAVVREAVGDTITERVRIAVDDAIGDVLAIIGEQPEPIEATA